MTPLEKIARGIGEEDGKRFANHTLYDHNPELFGRLARAALLALRNATDDTTLNGSIMCARLDMILSEQVAPAAHGRKAPAQ